MTKVHSVIHKAEEAYRDSIYDGVIGKLKNVFGGKLFLVDGELLKDNLLMEFGYSLINAGVFRLPFDVVALEITNAEAFSNGSQRLFMWCKQFVGSAYKNVDEREKRGDGDVQVFCTVAMLSDGVFRGIPSLIAIDCSTSMFSDYDFVMTDENHHGEVSEQKAQDLCKRALNILAAFVALINSKSARITEDPASEKLNKARAKKGKVPLQAVRYVDVPSLRVEGKSGTGGTHASPRMHWRRGHLRRWKDGVIPVSPCVVGAAENGVVQQIYRARKSSDGKEGRPSATS